MEYEEALEKMEVKLKELKRDYELYFKGDLRREPILEREKLQAAIGKFMTMHLPNTSLRFRANSFSNAFSAARRYWERVVQQIEAGTYRPDQFKADMRVGRYNPDTNQVERPAFETPKKTTPLEQVEEKKLRSLWAQFVEARRVTGENAKVSYDAFKGSLDKQKPSLEKKYGERLRFKVVIEDGKVKVKGYSS